MIVSKLARTGAFLTLAATLTLASFAQDAFAQDKLRLAVGQRGNWDTSVSEVGQRAGIFKKYGLELEILYTQGSGETQQAVLAGSAEIGIGAGIMGTIGAFSKGAPVRIIGAETTGSGDLFWYVRADSPIQSMKDLNDKTIAYSTAGSSTQGVVNAFMKEMALKAKPTATGSPSSTLAQVMSGQIDAGWSAPPFGLDFIDQKKIRVLATGNDTSFKGQTVRLVITNVQTLQGKNPLIDRYMKAYRETVDLMYKDPATLKIYADFVGIPEAIAKRTRDDFFPPASIDPDKITGLDAAMPDAVTFKYIAAPLTEAQIKELIQIPPR
jgi:NitT/TauT family transport system substrate-binding protein